MPITRAEILQMTQWVERDCDPDSMPACADKFDQWAMGSSATTRQPQSPPLDFWDVVAKQEAAGMTRSEAIRDTAVNEPALHAAMLESNTGQGRNAQPSTTPRRQPPPRRTAPQTSGVNPLQTQNAGAFWDLVDVKVVAGMPKPRAIRAVVAEFPELHQAMLRANQVPRRAR